MKRAWITSIIIGGAIGVLNLGHYVVTARVDGVETPFGLFPGGFPFAVAMAVSGQRLTSDTLVMLVLGAGILSGAALSARIAGDLTWARIRGARLRRRKVLRALTGGVLMGMGVWMAEGCLIKHTLSGMPGLMLSSWLTLAGIAVGIWIAAKVADGSG